jgi:long-chain acyl-CoA synthetase
VRAVVVRAPGSDLDAEGLRTFAARSLARFKVPSTVLFVEQLPHSLTGKVSRARLRELGMDALAEQTQHAEGIDGGTEGGTGG